MAKLVKSGKDEWKVLDDNCIIGGTVADYIYGSGGNVVGAKMVGGTRPSALKHGQRHLPTTTAMDTG